MIPKDLVQYFNDGKRLGKPTFAPNVVGALMAQCWEKEPNARPSFSELEMALGNMLEATVLHQYFKLNNADLQRPNDIPNFVQPEASSSVSYL